MLRKKKSGRSNGNHDWKNHLKPHTGYVSPLTPGGYVPRPPWMPETTVGTKP